MKPISEALNLMQHYFFIFPESYTEVHPGTDIYKKKFNTSYVICQLLFLCNACFQKKKIEIANFCKIWCLFPLINCETLTFNGNISFQLIYCTILILLIVYKIFIFIPFILIMLKHNYNFTYNKIYTCSHLT